ncbi:MAG: protein-L-isoaspartate(D-aspartate) O-methyltransferase [Bacteroidota bacterium]
MLDTFKHKGQRKRLVQELMDRGITDKAVLDAVLSVPRHGFIDTAFSDEAYEDKALPIPQGQTISQPFTVAYQTQLLRLKPRMKVLEIGTGSGYQAAILSAMGVRVFSVEIDPKLHRLAKRRLEDLECNCKLLQGDGSQGWTLYQPYDRIIVTAASPGVPEPLKKQLAAGGIMVIPSGDRDQQHMQVVTRKRGSEYEIETLQAFRFVPLRGKYGFKIEAE